MRTWLASGLGVGTSFTSHLALTAGTTAAFIRLPPLSGPNPALSDCRRLDVTASAQVPVGVIRHIVLEEAGDARHLLNRHLGKDLRRIFQVPSRRLEHDRHLFFAFDQGMHAVS